VIDDDALRAGADVCHLGEPASFLLDHERAAARRRSMLDLERCGFGLVHA